MHRVFLALVVEFALALSKLANLQEPSNSTAPRPKVSDIYNGTEATTAIRVATISRAKARLDICDDTYGTASLVQNDSVRTCVQEAAVKRKIPVRLITDITPENLAACKKLSGFVELRHVSGVKGNFAVTESEYYYFTALTKTMLPEQAIHSSQPALVEHEQYVFQSLWGRAIPAEQKIREIEEGVLAATIEVSRDPNEIQSYFTELVRAAQKEILFLFPTVEAFQREETIGIIDELQKCAFRGVEIRIVTPVTPAIVERIERISDKADSMDKGGSVQYKEIETSTAVNTVTILVVDRKISLLIEQKDNKQLIFSKAIGLATFSNSKPSVSSHALFFEALWREAELRKSEALAREEETKARRQSELLQDILTHDIRNYNQVVKLSSELLEEEFGQDERVREVIDNMLDAVNGSTQLLERAKKLGKILSEKMAYLYPVDVLDVMKVSIATVKKAHPEKKIDFRISNRLVEQNPSSSTSPTSRILVVADDLLAEVFVNAFTNSVKYAEHEPVEIEAAIESEELEHREKHRAGEQTRIKILVIDNGRGIPDEMKSGLFGRYLMSAKGTGLGMSIIHALVVERYRGTVRIKNRVPEDYSRGTVLEITLPYSPKLSAGSVGKNF